MNRPDFAATGGAGGFPPSGPPTGPVEYGGPPSGPPFSVDVIADVQAQVYAPEVNERLRAQILADPEAREIFEALNSVSDELSLLPPLTMPAQYAERLDAAIAHEASARAAATSSASTNPTGFRPLSLVPSAPGAPAQFAPTPPASPAGSPSNVVSLDQARSRRRGVIAGLSVAAAVAAIAAVTLTLVNNRTPGASTAGQASPTPTSVTSTLLPGGGITLPSTGVGTSTGAGNPGAPGGGGPTGTSTLRDITVDPNNPQAAFDKVNGRSSGDLSNPLAAASCFASLNLTGPNVLGVSDGDYQGAPVYVIATAVVGDSAHANLFVVAKGCGQPGVSTSVLLQKTVTR